MRIRWLLSIAVLLLVSVTLGVAQVSFRGRIFLPNGEPLFGVTRFILASEDSRFSPVYEFTDSKGWFYLRNLRNNARYSVTVESDGQTYATTTEWFIAGRTPFITVQLLPLEETEGVPKAPAVSAQQLQHKPPPDARRAYEAALKAISEQKVGEARSKLRKAIELDAAYVNAYNELAVLEIGEKRYAEAEALLRTALQKDPDAPHPLMNLGIALNYMGRYPDAIEPLRKTLRLRPQWLTPKVYLGIALLETDQLAEAENFLQRGTTATGREEALAYLYLGKLYVAKGDREKAIAAWENYLQRDPDSPNATNVRALLARLRQNKP